MLLCVFSGKAQQEFEKLGSLHGEAGSSPEGSSRAKRFQDNFQDKKEVTKLFLHQKGRKIDSPFQRLWHVIFVCFGWWWYVGVAFHPCYFSKVLSSVPSRSVVLTLINKKIFWNVGQNHRCSIWCERTVEETTFPFSEWSYFDYRCDDRIDAIVACILFSRMLEGTDVFAPIVKLEITG